MRPKLMSYILSVLLIRQIESYPECCDETVPIMINSTSLCADNKNIHLSCEGPRHLAVGADFSVINFLNETGLILLHMDDDEIKRFHMYEEPE